MKRNNIIITCTCNPFNDNDLPYGFEQNKNI